MSGNELEQIFEGEATRVKTRFIVSILIHAYERPMLQSPGAAADGRVVLILLAQCQHTAPEIYGASSKTRGHARA